VNSILITDAYHEQCNALEQKGYKPRFVSLTPIACATLLAETPHSLSEVIPPIIVNPYQSEIVVVTTDSSIEIIEAGALARIRRSLWIKYLRKKR